MVCRELPVEEMLPRISLCRFFETINAPPKNSLDRIAECYELSFYIRGNGSVHIDGTDYAVHYGDIRFSRPGTYLKSIPHYDCYTIYFDFGRSYEVCHNPLLDGIPDYFHIGGELRGLFEEILAVYTSGGLTAPVKQNALLLDLLVRLFDSIYSRRKYCAAVEQCIAYMEEHFADDMTLEELGERFGYSRLHLLRLFKKDTGATPHDFLTALRLNHAKHLLIYTEQSLPEIAAACGFGSDAHFKTLFKKKIGFTPGHYRKNARKL